MHREPRVLEAEAKVGTFFDCIARITFQELAQLHCVKNGITQNACSTSPRMDAELEKSALMRIARLTNSLARSKKKMATKFAVAILKDTRQLGCVCHEMEPPKSSSTLRKSSNILKPIRCVRFTKAVLRHANIRDQNQSLGKICPTPKFEDGSQVTTEWQERDARETAWKMARCILKLKEKHKTTFFSPSENCCLPSPSTIKP